MRTARSAIAVILISLTALTSCANRNVTDSPSLDEPSKKAIAMELVSSAENSSLDWKAQYSYLEDIGDGRGYTGGIIGFTSATGDMLRLVIAYTGTHSDSPLASFVPALEAVNGTDAHSGLGIPFVDAWSEAAKDPGFQRAQNDLRDQWYFDPAVRQAKADGLRALGQFIYYDAIVVHGPGDDPSSFSGIRKRAMLRAQIPATGGDESAYLDAFLDVRRDSMRTEEAHKDTSRVDTAQRVFLRDGNFDLTAPLTWQMYGDTFHID